MGIVQINVWMCEVCEFVESTTEQTSPYCDPVVAPRGEEWEYIVKDGVEKLACPTCLKKNEKSEDETRL